MGYFEGDGVSSVIPTMLISTVIPTMLISTVIPAKLISIVIPAKLVGRNLLVKPQKLKTDPR
ncbi:hypothetical protein [Shewanella gaetbuli]